MQQVTKRVREQSRILADERGNRKINRRLKEAMKRYEEGEERLEITKEEEEKGPPPEESSLS